MQNERKERLTSGGSKKTTTIVVEWKVGMVAYSGAKRQRKHSREAPAP